jgi:hypothetical protein
VLSHPLAAVPSAETHQQLKTSFNLAHSNSDEAEEEGAPPLDLRRLKSGSASGSNPSSRESTPRPSPLHSPLQSPRRGGDAADIDEIGDAILKLQVPVGLDCTWHTSCYMHGVNYLVQ